MITLCKLVKYFLTSLLIFISTVSFTLMVGCSPTQETPSGTAATTSPTTTPMPTSTEPTTLPPSTTTSPSITTEETGLVGLNLPDVPLGEKRLDVEKIYSGGEEPGLCYLGSYAMLAKYADNDIDFSYVIASSGLGASAVYIPEINLMMNGYSIGCIGNAAVNQGFEYYIVALEGATITDEFFASNLAADATEIITLGNEAEAIDLLERVISAGIPVMVHLDITYIKEAMIANTSYMQFVFAFAGEGHIDHYMTVSGYDGEFVYLNDPTEKVDGMGKDIPVAIADFLDAWENGNNIYLEPSSRIGPYWMLFLGQRGTPKTAEELIAWNYDIGASAIGEIRKAAEHPNINPMMHCNEMARARQELGLFFKANGYIESGELFIEISEIFSQLDTSYTKQADLLRIAELQEEALGKMPVQ